MFGASDTIATTNGGGSRLPAGVQVGLGALLILSFAILILRGVAPFVAFLVVGFTIIALYRPLIVIGAALLLAPLLGRTGDSFLGPLNGMGFLAIWVLGMATVAVLLNFGKIRQQRVVVIAALLPVLATISILGSAHRGVSAAESVRMFAAFAVLPMTYLLADTLGRRKAIVGLVLASCFVPVVVGYYQIATGNVDHGANLTLFEIQSGITRIYGTFYDVHPFAKYLLIPLLLASAFLVSGKYTLRQQVALFCAVALLFVCLVHTYARSQLIGFVFGFGLLLMGYRKVSIRVTVLLGLIVFVLIATTGVLERFSDLFQMVDLDAGDRTNSLKGRLIIWAQGLPLALQQPWMGYGAATFEHDIGIKSHNVYLGLFYELGILAPFLYVWLLVVSARCTKRLAATNTASDFDKNLGMGLWSITLAIAVVSLVENYVQSTTMWWAYFALLGAALRAYDIGTKRAKQ